MSQSSINGRAAPLDAAIAEAAGLIRKSRLTVVAGLGADVAGAQAAIALCERIGGVVDHMSSTALLRDLDVLRESGMMLTTPGEARMRGDVVLLVGDGLAESGLLEAMPDLRKRALRPPAAEGARRRIFRLGAGEADLRALAGAAADGVPKIETISADEASLPGWLAALRARVNGRPVALSGARSREIDALAAALQSAKFGVAVWSAARLDVLTIEMLCGLVRDLNAKTRFTGLPLAPGDNAAGVLQVCGGMIGFPMRTGFGSGFPEHDPWVFDAERLVESGEADCALWISAYGAEAPRWRKPIPLIALTTAAAEFSRPPTVRIAVGRPGVDHDSVDYCPAMGTLVSKAASHPSQTPSVAEVIGKLVVALGDDAGAASC
jgi:formylmethanofuran dehydrogenase subunit B